MKMRERVRDILSLVTLWMLLAAVISGAYAQNYTNDQSSGQPTAAQLNDQELNKLPNQASQMQMNNGQQMNGQPAADNSAMNVRDRAGDEATADNATNNMSDRQIMQRIRKDIVDDSTISTNGHNIKVIAQNGHVTLKGPVQNSMERKKIEHKASYVVGKDNVTDRLSVQADQ